MSSTIYVRGLPVIMIFILQSLRLTESKYQIVTDQMEREELVKIVFSIIVEEKEIAVQKRKFGKMRQGFIP